MPVSLKVLRRFSKVKAVINDRNEARNALAQAQAELGEKRSEVRFFQGKIEGLEVGLHNSAASSHDRAEQDSLKARIAELERDLEARPAIGTEAFDLVAAERQRDRMRNVQPHIPVSTAGVFSYSQHQQELFALERHGFKRNGFFIEIGVGTGKEYSNTYLLEKHFGWNGILCEPNPTYSESIGRERSVVLETQAAYSVSGETVRFLCVPGIYGLLSTISSFSGSDHHTRYGEEVEVTTISLEDMLVRHGAPREIDYMSLDTEGSETDIIRDFDFDKWRIAVMTIEHNLVPGRVEEMDRILIPHGYKRVLSEVSSVDAWYVRD